MKLQWTPNVGLLPVILGDDAVKYAVRVEQVGGASLVQSEDLAGGANKASFARGNIGGSFVFRSTKTYASVDAADAQFKTEYNRLNQQGTLVQTTGATTTTFANAILKGVQRIFDAESGGARMSIRYTFDITTIA